MKMHLIVLLIYEFNPVSNLACVTEGRLRIPKLLQNSPESFAEVIYDLIATDRVIDWLFWLPFGSIRAPIPSQDIKNEISRLTSAYGYLSWKRIRHIKRRLTGM